MRYYSVQGQFSENRAAKADGLHFEGPETMSELIIHSGKLKGKRLVLPAKEMIVGRDEDCDLRIASSLVSRKHCSLKSTPEGILVTDLESQNGTHVNDVAISEPTILCEGDTLRIGATVLAVPAPPRIKLPPGNQNQISESEIADWLTDSGSNFSGGDTAVIPNYPPAPAAAAAAAAPTPAPPTTPPARSQGSRVLSVKDEAAAVIRKHWESVKAKKKS